MSAVLLICLYTHHTHGDAQATMLNHLLHLTIFLSYTTETNLWFSTAFTQHRNVFYWRLTQLCNTFSAPKNTSEIGFLHLKIILCKQSKTIKTDFTLYYPELGVCRELKTSSPSLEIPQEMGLLRRTLESHFATPKMEVFIPRFTDLEWAQFYFNQHLTPPLPKENYYRTDVKKSLANLVLHHSLTK